MPGPVVVVGSSNIDLIMKMERLPRPGETVTEAEFAQVFGGKGANQAVAAARAGGEVAFVSCVGDDAYGGQVIENLKRDGEPDAGNRLPQSPQIFVGSVGRAGNEPQLARAPLAQFVAAN